MTDRELLLAMYNDTQEIKRDVQVLVNDMQGLKEEVRTLKKEVQVLKDDVQILKQRVTNIELTLENETNRHIQLLAENHISLVDKLNGALRVQDKSMLYEIKVDGLQTRVNRLEQEMKELKSKIA